MRTATALLLGVLALGGPAAGAADEMSPAEQRVFVDRHLDGLPDGTTLHYDYRRRVTGEAEVRDEVALTARGDDTRGRTVALDYLHGERRLVLPDAERAYGNPIILHFLEADVRAMRRELGGQENYFRRRIRLALADEAQLRSVTVPYGGGLLPATEVLFRPYADDPLQARFRGKAGKAYIFTLAPQVPGGVYQLRTVVDDPAGGASPLVEEVLTLRAPLDARPRAAVTAR